MICQPGTFYGMGETELLHEFHEFSPNCVLTGLTGEDFYRRGRGDRQRNAENGSRTIIWRGAFSASDEKGRGMCREGRARDKRKPSRAGSVASMRGFRQEDLWPFANEAASGASEEQIVGLCGGWESARAVQAGWHGSVSQRAPADRRAFPGWRRREGRRSARNAAAGRW